MDDLALTVLIPTRDRWKLLLAQTRAVDEELRRLDVRFEIVVHDNSSRETPQDEIERLPPEVRHVRAPELYDTAEENIHAALVHCRGRFIWLLADDDGLEPAGLAELVRLIGEDKEDIIVFNSRHGRDERLPGVGAYVTERSRRLFYHNEMRCSIAQFVQRTGHFYWLCAISTVVIRREIADRELLAKYIGLARIYAHVAWLIEIGRGRRFLFVNRPLVVYGLLPTDHDGGRHWRNVGVREGGYENAVWTGLWLRVLEELIRVDAVSLDQMRRTVDLNHETRFHWASNFAHQVLAQYGELDAAMPDEDVELTGRWLRWLFPGAIFLSALVEEMAAFVLLHRQSLVRAEADPKLGQKARMTAADLRRRAAWWRSAIEAASWWSRLYVETVRMYDVYDFGDEWVAAHTGYGALRETLEVIDMPSLPPVFLRASSHAELMAAIAAQPGCVLEAEVRQARLELPNEWGRLAPASGMSVVVNTPASPPPAVHVAVASPTPAAIPAPVIPAPVIHVSAEAPAVHVTVEAPPAPPPTREIVRVQDDSRVQELEREVEKHQATLQAVLGSSSWRIAAPVRWVGGLFRRGGA